MTIYALEKPKLEMREVNDKEFNRYTEIIDPEGERYSVDEGFKRYMERTFGKPFKGDDHRVFFENGEPRGYVVLERKADASIIDLKRITVHQDHREKGYGKRIMEIVKNMTKKEGRKLRVSTMPAWQGFFLKCGLKTHDFEELDEIYLTYE